MKRKRVLLLLCILSCTLQLFAQQINVQGIVYDPSGETVPGANVSMKSNPAVGTVTDIDGNFSLKTSVGDVLVFTFIGYEPIEYKLTAADTNLKVRFTDSSELLDEVVVVGYGVQKKSVLSSAVSRVTSEELDKGNPTNIQNALKGKVSGVQIISNSGQPGAESKIRIRGTGTVNNSDPLYIVDGMPSESGISHLNPSDIESIEVLKDAASAAIYGARGANGVVLITTKKGTKGKATLNYEFTYGIQNPSKKVDLLGSADYQMLMNEMAANAGKDPYFPTVSSVNTDWQKELQNKNAPIMNHKVSLSGGTDNSTYYASFGYVKQEGIYAKGHADYERYNVRLNYNNVLLDTKSRNWLNKISFGAIASYSKSIQTGNTIGNSEAAGLITSMMNGDTDKVNSQAVVVLFLLVNVFLGLIGTFWFRTRRRRSEIALRMAMGSTRGGVFRLLIGEGLLLLALVTLPAMVVCYNVGMAEFTIGRTSLISTWPIEWSVIRFLAGSLGAWLLIALMVVIGIWFPARQAMKIEPAEALHEE